MSGSSRKRRRTDGEQEDGGFRARTRETKSLSESERTNQTQAETSIQSEKAMSEEHVVEEVFTGLNDEQSPPEYIKPGDRTDSLPMEEELIKIDRRSSYQNEPDLLNILTQDIMIDVENDTASQLS